MSQFTAAERARMDQIAEGMTAKAIGLASRQDGRDFIDAARSMTFALLANDPEPESLATIVAVLALRLHRGATQPHDATTQDGDPRG